ncbi:hypothetical protein REJC140_02388 [Pseudorhizobium endolithicum]|uniref:Uncharacterized protein n=1 Tax=Pseudorhizobium endolithicum TaxID=1191678 RepID=A0ABM8PF71_9HYPH|nr:hypothetical protein REJC140_02388 [Pseudorhizobium endolithicum]
MVSGYDKTPPEPRYEPEFGPAAQWVIIGLVIGLFCGAVALLFF